mmetsp:Transcript_4368/g.8752  ORF Transcript_4368/g.8752 Transcript_4368/m.8752 type:complete len:83 (+) Transcript_4368:178-426(+)
MWITHVSSTSSVEGGLLSAMLGAHVTSPSIGTRTGGSGGGAHMGDCPCNGWGVTLLLGFQTQGGMLSKHGAVVGSDTGMCRR